MDILSFFRRRAGSAEASPAETPDVLQEARTRARRRLIGAAVLVAIGIVVFPVLFETQPRPIPIDLPIDIPRKDNAPPLAMPGARVEAPAPAAEPSVVEPRRTARAETAVPADEPVITETPADAGREVPPPASAAERPKPKPKPSVAASAPPAKRTTAETKPADRDADAERAQALLEGRIVAAAKPEPAAATPSAAASAAGRFVVQVGAFAEDPAARDARSKVERLGMKTYVQVADTANGKRIRVRVGPYASRDEAERAAAKLRSSALPAVILAL